MRVPADGELTGSRGNGGGGSNGGMNCGSESAGSVNTDAFDRDSRAGTRNKLKTEGAGGGGESKSTGRADVNMNVRDNLLSRLLAMSFEC